MSSATVTSPKLKPRLSLDTIAVIASLLLAAAVRLGLLRHIPW